MAFSPVKRRRRIVAARGFTLFEILVVLIIILTVTMIVLTSEGAFNRTLILKNTAYDIALAIRSAQSLGLGTRVGSGGLTNVGYGVRFVRNTNSFIIFPDVHPPPLPSTICHPLPIDRGSTQDSMSAPDALYGDCSFDQGQDVPYQTMTLGNGVRITAVCRYTNAWICNTSGTTAAVEVVFSRPNSEPMFAYNANSNAKSNYDSNISRVCIKISSPEGGTRAIKIESSGLINPNAPAGAANSC